MALLPNWKELEDLITEPSKKTHGDSPHHDSNRDGHEDSRNCSYVPPHYDNGGKGSKIYYEGIGLEFPPFPSHLVNKK